MELEVDIIVLNNATKFHKILIKLFDSESGHRFKRFHKQRTKTPESIMRYGPLSNLKKQSCYLTM